MERCFGAKKLSVLPFLLCRKAELDLEALSENEKKDLKIVLKNLEEKCAQSSESLLIEFYKKK